jgi:hypothetical protein
MKINKSPKKRILIILIGLLIILINFNIEQIPSKETSDSTKLVKSYINGVEPKSSIESSDISDSKPLSRAITRENDTFSSTKTWWKTFGHKGFDIGYSTIQTLDGNYITVGSISSFEKGSTDAYVIKVDLDGNLIWEKTFGGEKEDVLKSIQKSDDRGYLITGWTNSYGNKEVDTYGEITFDIWLLKIDNNGTEIWNKTYGFGGHEKSFSILQTHNNSYIINGNTNSYSSGGYDAWILKVNHNGDVLWSTTIGGLQDDYLSSIEQTSDNGYIASGWTTSFGVVIENMWLLKLDKDGNEEWNITYKSESANYGFSVKETTDKGFLIAGKIFSSKKNYFDAWLLKTNFTGNITWSKIYEHEFGTEFILMQEMNDGTYTILGNYDINNKNRSDIWLLKIDNEGIKQFDKFYHGSKFEQGFSINLTPDNGLIITGQTTSFGTGNSDVILIKIDSDLGLEYENIGPEFLWFKTYGGSGMDSGYNFLKTNDGHLVIVGSSSSPEIGDGLLLMKLDYNGNEIWTNTIEIDYSESGDSIKQTSDGGFIIVGTVYTYDNSIGETKEDILLLKTDSNGKKSWFKRFDRTDADSGESIFITDDGGYLIVGLINRNSENDDQDVWMIKTDNFGNLKWEKIFGGENDDYLGDIIKTNDGGYIFIGNTFTNNSNKFGIWVVKIDSTGRIEWEKTFDDKLNGLGSCIIETRDNGYFVIGSKLSYDGDIDILIIKINSTGNEQWNKLYGGNDPDSPYSVQRTFDGNYIIAGHSGEFSTENSTWILKINENGDQLWDMRLQGRSSPLIISIIQDSCNGFLILGSDRYWETEEDITLIKIGNKDLQLINKTPTCSIITPEENSVWSIVTISGTSFDPDGNIEKVELKINGGEWEIVDGTTNWSYSWNTINIEDGEYTIYVRSFDGKLYSEYSILNLDVINGVMADKIKPPKQTWKKTFGGDVDEFGSDIIETPENEYVITAYKSTKDYSESQAWLIKLDNSGDKIWSKTYGGNSWEGAESILLADDGGYIVGGWTESYGEGDSDYWLFKIDSSGKMIWDRTFGGKKSDSCYSVGKCDDGGYILTGYSVSFSKGKSDVWLVKTDSKGNKEWDRSYGGVENDGGMYVQQTNDMGYMIIGETRSYSEGYEDVWLIKTDSNGNELWNKTYGGKDSDMGYSGKEIGGGGYIIVGKTSSFGSIYSQSMLFLVKTDENGNEIWNRYYGGENYDDGHSVFETEDRGYIIGGTAHNNDGFIETFWLIKTDENGYIQWEIKEVDRDAEDRGQAMKPTSDGGYIMVGYTYSSGEHDVIVMKFGGKVEDDKPQWIPDVPTLSSFQKSIIIGTVGISIIVVSLLLISIFKKPKK